MSLKIEIIICSCGSIFAACCEGYQDEQWKKNRSEYLRAGCRVEVVEGNIKLSSCDCSKVPAKNQLNLFEN